MTCHPKNTLVATFLSYPPVNRSETTAFGHTPDPSHFHPFLLAYCAFRFAHRKRLWTTKSRSNSLSVSTANWCGRRPSSCAMITSSKPTKATSSWCSTITAPSAAPSSPVGVSSDDGIRPGRLAALAFVAIPLPSRLSLKMFCSSLSVTWSRIVGPVDRWLVDREAASVGMTGSSWGSRERARGSKRRSCFAAASRPRPA